MSATPDVVMRSLQATLKDNMATESQIKGAFVLAGYGQKKTDKWWNYYRTINYIRPVMRNGLSLMNEQGEQLYSSEFWLNPLVMV